ncbi:MAG: mechanosensitive ion channel family protein [Christensenellaceae bacterium]|jgi:small conductance mechanosensitive channel
MAESPEEVLQEAAQTLSQWEQDVFPMGFLNTIILAGVVGVVIFIVIKLLGRFLGKKRAGNLVFFYRLICAILILIGAGIVMSTIKPLQEFTATIIAGSGFIAVVIGIAAQSSLGNVFSGISIGAGKPFVIGEIIEIVGQNLMGTVVEIGLRHTIIKDAQNKKIVVPNSVLDKEIVRAFGSENPAIVNYLYVGIGYDSDVDMAIRLLLELVRGHKYFYDTRTAEQKEQGFADDGAAVHIVNFGPSSIDLRASVWSKDAATGFGMLSDLRYAILQKFRENGIEIPYGYQNVILKQEDKAALPDRKMQQ